MFFSRLKNLRTNEKDLFSNGSICKEKKDGYEDIAKGPAL
jgi:hypothetical protein